MNNVEDFLSHRHEFNSYKFMGCKLKIKNGERGAEFSVWAPNAKEVMVVGDFNNWDGCTHSMKNIEKSGFFNIFIEEIKDGDLYKYKIITNDGKILFKADPYGYFSEVRPNTASIVTDLKEYLWNDKNWMMHREKRKPYDMPINIYEVHLGSWDRGHENRFYSYMEIADKLLSYVVYMGYTHIELLPVTEHPLDDSWGYQTTGYFSLTSRFGSPKEFMYLVNKFHEKNIGIILDWVPGHFCKDEHGLYKFDGTNLYQYDNPELGENYDWGSANFDLGKVEVREFLISNAMFWFELYHIDGMRVDAVSNMLYLDYGTRHDMDLKNSNGTNENLEAVSFIRELNETIFRNYPNVLMVAEESTAWKGVSAPTSTNGLGFNYKWNMGWMNDMLKYMKLNSNEKKAQHGLITFSLMYAFSENYILPLSHDEVVHCKKSLLSKMPGGYDDKFSSLRLFYGYTMAHPGKKLLFMGGEFGQFIEWNPNNGLDWLLLEYPKHKKLQRYTKALNEFYKDEKALWQKDHTSDGFDWIDPNNSNQSVISFARIGHDRDDYLIVVCNFSPVSYGIYKVGVPELVNYVEVFNSDNSMFGGNDKLNNKIILPIFEKWNNKPYCINITLPALSIVFIKKEKQDVLLKASIY
ncbi:1,4-alpha-glucan branching protein GlgB [Clostridium estertheticum]|uniref:1,4-alpha-glucan branching protein GlgB n=1 Tax=Clostridium estertheticum TaxID=238834 RepID=UPI001C0AC545|nr:1,4-alpha-glucan branching protein GlgB [Clostridium estertheticum]MBU3197791.1 1,4-alpha-glucan branching protein GlgB [Clostridium estertheticum]WAG65591.1 1,4-alpha-glucan branching protein GlgB [Clostridium estertheticum]